MSLDVSKKKIAYEWVLVMSKGDDILLSEPQYEFFKKNMKEAKVVFSELGFSPGFVIQFFKRPATNWLKDKYPCNDCTATGRNAESTDWCETCGGSGVKIPA